jgi:hypothetical protein
MKTRDEYVTTLKAELDLWNARAAKWEQASSAAKSKQLAEYRDQRDKVLYNLKLLENASSAAWTDLVKGTDEAWDAMLEAYEKARKHFERSGGKARA